MQGPQVLIPVWGTRSHMHAATMSPHAATKIRQSQNKMNIKKKKSTSVIVCPIYILIQTTNLFKNISTIIRPLEMQMLSTYLIIF